MLCHGGPGLWDMFGPVTDMLGGLARTIRWDQRGCGRSEGRGPYTVARCVADLDAVRQRLAGARTALLGHSWGATLALRYAIQHPDRVEKLIYVSGTGIDAEPAWKPAYHRQFDERLGESGARVAALRTRTRTRDEDRELAVLQLSADFADRDEALRLAGEIATPWFPLNYDCNAALNAEAQRYLADNDVAARCRALDVPTLIIDGAHDIRPRSAVDSLHEALPRVRRVTLAAGHLPWVEEPDGFRAAVADFLA